MKTYPKKRIEIVIESPVVDRVTDCLDRMGVTGYSAILVTAGRGQRGAWSSSGQIGTALQMVQIVCIADANLAEQVIQELFEIVKPQAGFLTISDVSVLRPGRF